MSNYSLTLLSAFSFNLIIGLFVLFKKRGDPTAQSFFLLILMLTFWLLGCYGESIASSKKSALLWDKLIYTGVSLYPFMYFNFLYSVLDIKKNKKVLIILGLISAVFLTLNFSPFRYYFVKDVDKVFTFRYIAVPNIFWYALVSLVTLTSVFGIIMKYNLYRKSTGYRKNQLKYLLVAFMILTSGGGMYFLLPLSIKVPPIDAAFVVMFSVIIASTILRYRLMDIRLIFKKTMAYSLSAGLLMGFFVVLVLAVTNFLSGVTEVDSLKISIIAAFVIALLFNPLRNKIQVLVDKLFYKKTYDYYSIIRKVSHDLASMFDIKKIYGFVCYTILSTLGLNCIYFLSAGSGGNYKVLYFRTFEKTKDKSDKADKQKDERTLDSVEKLELNKNSWIVKSLAVSGEILIKDELAREEANPDEEFIKSVKEDLKLFNGEVAVPIIIDDKLESIMILGGKRSGDIFSNEDVNLLDTLSYQTSIAIKNASLYADKVHSARLASIGMLSGTFAHEIRNPLTSIKTFAQLMPEKYADTEFRESFSKIVVNEIERIDGLIKDLLSFSGKKADTPDNHLDLTALVDETLNNVINKLELEKSKITVEKVYKNVKIHLFGDSKKLTQAFINVISNGCQAMQDNGVLKVNIVPKELEVDVTFTDTGKGIDPNEMNSIFDPFYTKRPMGVGLGLAISKKIVEDHGGRIGVESKMLKGTTFTISLPLQNRGDE